MKTIISLLLLAVVNFIHCQENDQMIVFNLQGVLQKLEDISDTLKGYEDIQQKQDEIMDKLMGHEELLHRIPDVQEKLEHLENNVQGHQELLQRIPDVQEKLKHLENNLQELHHELEHVKGAVVKNRRSLRRLSQETGQCLRRDDLEHLSNISAAAHQEIKSFVHEEISGVISFAEQDIDECIQGSAECDSNAKCTNILGSYSCSCNLPFKGDGRTCSCPSEGFASNGDICEDLDECSSAEGKGVCAPNAVCKNSIGSYSCSCNKPFEGDGITSCALPCRSPAKFFSGVGCIKRVGEAKSYQDMNDFCQEEGGRLWTNFNQEQLNYVRDTFHLGGLEWVGVYDGKWTSDEESLVPEDLWGEERGYRPDPSKRCGVVGYFDWKFTFSKMFQWDCSKKTYGYCQF